MGCDIHMAVQYRDEARSWKTATPPVGRWGSLWYEPRIYSAFAALAGVRNSTGIVPISKPRGLPEDIKMIGDELDGKWLGDHSHSWLLVSEILDYPHPEHLRGYMDFFRSLRELVGAWRNDDVRIVFGFDS